MTPQTLGALELRQVVKRYGRQTVLDGLSLSLRAGEIRALAGIFRDHSWLSIWFDEDPFWTVDGSPVW